MLLSMVSPPHLPSYFWCSTGLCSGPSPFSYLHQWGGWDSTEW